MAFIHEEPQCRLIAAVPRSLFFCLAYLAHLQVSTNMGATFAQSTRDALKLICLRRHLTVHTFGATRCWQVRRSCSFQPCTRSLAASTCRIRVSRQVSTYIDNVNLLYSKLTLFIYFSSMRLLSFSTGSNTIITTACLHLSQAWCGSISSCGTGWA